MQAGGATLSLIAFSCAEASIVSREMQRRNCSKSMPEKDCQTMIRKVGKQPDDGGGGGWMTMSWKMRRSLDSGCSTRPLSMRNCRNRMSSSFCCDS
eukprot:3058713-Rhodomonas_salina.1